MARRDLKSAWRWSRRYAKVAPGRISHPIRFRLDRGRQAYIDGTSSSVCNGSARERHIKSV